MIQSNINSVIHRDNDKPIIVDTFFSETQKNQPIVIFCHGYKGFKDWGAWNIMAKQIAQAGFCFVKFNFSHNGGTLEDPIDFPDLEAFGNNNYTKELDDLNAVLNWVEHTFENNPAVNTSEMYLIGHSRGGGISILKTAEDSRIKKLICLASVSDFESRFGSQDAIDQWKKDGVKYVLNGRTKQQMPHFYQFYEDFKANQDRLNIENASRKISIPQLIIHGAADTSVKSDEAYALHQWNPNSELQIIENADHVFNIRHPWEKEEPSIAFNEAITLMIDFLR